MRPAACVAIWSGQTHLDKSHHEQSLHGAIRAQSLLKAPVLREKEQRVVPALLLQHAIVARPLACESQTQTLVDGKRESGPGTLGCWRHHEPKGGAGPCHMHGHKPQADNINMPRCGRANA